MGNDKQQLTRAETFDFHEASEVRYHFLLKKMLRSKKLSKLLPGWWKEKKLIPIAAGLTSKNRGSTRLVDPEPIKKEELRFISEERAPAIDLPEEPDEFPSIDLIVIPDARVTGSSNMITMVDHVGHHNLLKIKSHKLGEEVHRRVLIDHARRVIRSPQDPQPIRIRKVAAFTDHIACNYAHWLTEVLPRIFMLETTEPDPEIYYAIDSNLHANIYRSLELIVKKPRNIIALPPGRQIQAQEVYYITPTAYIPFEHHGQREAGHSHGIFSSHAINTMANKIKANVTPETKNIGKNIFIKRNSGYRNLLNENDLEEILERHGFDIVEPEKMSFDDQVAIFSNADTIIGTTGAAAANIIFARPDCNIFILLAEHNDMPYLYWKNMGQSVGVKVNYVLGKTVAHLERGLHADFSLPFKQINHLLDKLSIKHDQKEPIKMTDAVIHPTADVKCVNIGPRTTVWQFVVILPDAKIGADCNICSHCFIENDVVIGDRVTIKSGVQLWNGLRVGRDVFIGPNVTFTNDKYPRSRNTSFTQLETSIGDHASIGGGAVILPGIKIGSRAVVGAGAVVTKDVEPGQTVVGNPAQPLERMGEQHVQH